MRLERHALVPAGRLLNSLLWELKYVLKYRLRLDNFLEALVPVIYSNFKVCRVRQVLKLFHQTLDLCIDTVDQLLFVRVDILVLFDRRKISILRHVSDDRVRIQREIKGVG